MLNYNNYLFRLNDVIDNSINLILYNPYVSGVGIGYKTVNDKVLDIPCLTFLVHKKMTISEIIPKYRIPKYINNVITDVFENPIHHLFRGDEHRNRFARPATAGGDIGNAANKNINGTIGYALTEKDNGKGLYIVSCSHVITTAFESKVVESEILYPSYSLGGRKGEGGKTKDEIGILFRSTELRWAKSSDPKEIIDKNAIHDIDAAYVYVGENNLRTQKEKLKPYFKMGNETISITKTKTTDFSHILNKDFWAVTSNSFPDKKKGKIKLYNVTQEVSYFNEDKFMILKNQILVESAKGYSFNYGDSGAIGVIDGAENMAFGMLVTGVYQIRDINKALFTPIDRVLDFTKSETEKFSRDKVPEMFFALEKI